MKITMMKHLMIVAVLAPGMGSGQAQAASTFNLSLSGIVGNGTYSSLDDSTYHYDQWSLSLNLDSGPITVSQGDTINATITLDQPFTVPASTSITVIGFGLSPDTSFSTDTGTSGTTSFFLAGAPVIDGSGSTTSSGWIPNSIAFFPPANIAFTFDSLTSNFNIDTLTGTVTLNSALMDYTLFSPAVASVPVPAAGWLFGSGLVGLARFKRKSIG